jgi:hypothetical protein
VFYVVKTALFAVEGPVQPRLIQVGRLAQNLCGKNAK